MGTTMKPPCSAPECDRESFVKGLCYAHYRRQLRGGTITKPVGMRGLTELPGPRVPQAVADTLRAVAASQNVTEYEFVRRIVMDWYERTTGKSAQPKAP